MVFQKELFHILDKSKNHIKIIMQYTTVNSSESFLIECFFNIVFSNGNIVGNEKPFPPAILSSRQWRGNRTIVSAKFRNLSWMGCAFLLVEAIVIINFMFKDQLIVVSEYLYTPCVDQRNGSNRSEQMCFWLSEVVVSNLALC